VSAVSEVLTGHAHVNTCRVCEVCDSPLIKRYKECYAKFYVRRFCSRNCYYNGEHKTTDEVVRFWAFVDKSDDDSCWLWTGKTQVGKGHAVFGVTTGCNVLAHRYSYTLNVGAIPDGLCVCHKCDTPKCVNPSHLFLGTKGDNNRDRSAKGRSAKSWSKLRRERFEASKCRS
jgi:HNH endonuclease